MPTTYKHGLLPDSADLDAYFQRIGYAGPRTATFETLAAIHRLHPQAIPFENLDALLGHPITLGSSAFERKMLRGGRGGWCFEQNLLLGAVLGALGFRVTGYAARVMWNVPEGMVRARTHMLLGVQVRGPSGEGADRGAGAGLHIADVGFGGLTLTGPLRLAVGVEQSTPHETFRLVEAGAAGFVLQVFLRGEWKPVYSFDLQPQILQDYELGNWYLGNFPESPFLKNLMAARVTPERRYGLMNNKLSTHHLRGESEQVTLGSVAELREALTGVLGITLPEAPELDSILARFVSIDKSP